MILNIKDQKYPALAWPIRGNPCRPPGRRQTGGRLLLGDIGAVENLNDLPLQPLGHRLALVHLQVVLGMTEEIGVEVVARGQR